MNQEKKKQLSLGVVFSYITIIAQFLSGVFYTPIILGSLGQSGYGVFSLCNSFSGYLTIFNAGMNAAYVRFYVQTKIKNEKNVPALNGLFARVFGVLACISLVVGLFISWKAKFLFGNKISLNEYSQLKQLFLILAFNTGVTVINCVFSSLVIANEHFIFGKLINLIEIVLEPVITIPLLLSGYGSEAIFAIKLILAVMVTSFNAWYCIVKLKEKFEFSQINKSLLKSILMFAGAIALQAVADQLYWQIDKLILAWTNGSTEISVYSVGSTFNNYYIMIACALSGVFIAEINRKVAQGKDDEVSDLFVKMSRGFALLVFLIMSGYCFIGKPFIMRWAGMEYERSYYVGMLVMLPVTASLTMGLGQDIVRAKNVHKIQIFINTVFCIGNFFISIPLAMKFGAVGSAVGTFITEVINCIIVQTIYYNRVAKLNMRAYYKEMLRMLPGLIPPVVYGVIISYFRLVKISYPSLAVYGLIYVFIYAFSMWVFSMNESEKQFAQKAVSKVFSKVKG